MENRNQRIEKRLNYIKPKQSSNNQHNNQHLANRNEKRTNESSTLDRPTLKAVSNKNQSMEKDSKNVLLNKKNAKNRQGVVLDRITNQIIDDHVDEVDIGYEAAYTTNRKRKVLVRGTRGIKHFVKSDNRARYLTSNTRHTGILQAQGMAMEAMESSNPVTDTASTATGRTATNVQATKEALKKGKTMLRGKQAIKEQNVIKPKNIVRDRNRFAKMKGISQNTAKILQQGSSGVKRVGNVFLAKFEEALASKALMILGIFFTAIILFGVALGGSGGALQMEEEEQLSFSSVGLSEDVLQWKDTVEAELAKYDLVEYVDLLLVIIQLESNGKLPDVMQSSESIGLPPNSIVDPIRSIKVGVAHFKSIYDDMNKHNVDIQTLIQAYNFGNGFIPYVANNGGSWKQNLSDKFASIHAKRLGWISYGDTNYVTKAMRYLTIEDNEISLIGGSFDLEGGKLAFPVPNYESGVSSSYGWRIHPIYGDRRFHAGTDIGAPLGATVIAAADGVVVEAGWKGGYGNTVVIDHGSGVKTLYGHNSSLDVQAGQTVKVGQTIARVGSTGSSTAPHSHFEVMKNGKYTNPVEWLDLN